MSHDRARHIAGPVFPHHDLRTPDAPTGVRRTFLDLELQRTFSERGHVAFDFLDPDLVVAVRAVFDDVGPAPGDDQDGYFPGNVSSSAAWKEEVIDRVTPLVQTKLDATFDRHHTFHLTFMVKWPGQGGKLQSHQDPTMVLDEGRNRTLNVWCPLHEYEPHELERRGMVRVVPGSTHLPSAQWYRARGGHVPAGFEEVESLVYDELAVPVPLKLGQALAIDHRLVHCSSPNLGQQPRIVLAIGLRPAEAPSVHVECDAEGWVEVREVDDRYFIEHPSVDPGRYPLLLRRRAQTAPALTRQDLDLAIGRPVDSADLPLLTEAATTPTARRTDRRLRRRPRPVAVLDHDDDRRLWRDGFVRLTGVSFADGLALPSPEATSASSPELAAGLEAALDRLEVISVRLEPAVPTRPARPHQAWTVTDERDGIRSYQLYVALEPLDGDRGQLAVLRGSHRIGDVLRTPGFEAPWLRHQRTIESRLEAIPLTTGEAVLVDAATVRSHHPATGGAPSHWLVADVVPRGAELIALDRLEDGRALRHPVPAHRRGSGPLVTASERSDGGTAVVVGRCAPSSASLGLRLDARPLAAIGRVRRLVR